MTIDEFAAAIQTQIATGAGLDGSKVIWANPNVPRPARPFIELYILEDGGEQSLPEEDVIDNPDADLNTGFLPMMLPQTLDTELSQNPILLQTTDRPEITVRCTAFAAAPTTGAVSPAFTLLKSVRRNLGGELAADALDPITVLDRGNVQNTTVMLETGYEGRAVLDLIFGSIETESDGVNTIEEVVVEVTIKDTDGSVIVDDTITLPNS